MILPKIFVLGDSISIHYGPYLEQYGADKFHYARKSGQEEGPTNLAPPQAANGGDSAQVLSYLQARQRAGGIGADILLLNCGLHDLKTDPDTGTKQVPLAQYRRNLKQVIQITREMGLALVWIRTTPCDEKVHNKPSMTFHRFAADCETYNTAADEIMQAAAVQSIDLYTFTRNLAPDLYCDHVHFHEPIREKQAAYIAGWLAGWNRAGMTMTNQAQTVLITGATGFLGSYIVDSYVSRNIPVKAMVRPTSDLTWLKAHLEAGKVTLTEGTMTDHASLHRAVEGVTHIVHTAAVIAPNTSNEIYEQVNVEGTRILVEAAVAAKIDRFTLISSVSTYGHGITPGSIVTEETPQMPSNPYGQSKLAQQELVLAAYRRHNLPVVLLEPPVIYGPRARVGIGEGVRWVKRGLAPLLDYGRGRMNLVYVTDVVSLLEAADADDAALGERFLAAGPRFTSHKEILQIIADSLTVRPLYLPIPLWITAAGLRLYNTFLQVQGKDIFFAPDYFYKFSQGADYRPDKACRMLGWEPKVDIRVGIPKTVAWFLANDLI